MDEEELIAHAEECEAVADSHAYRMREFQAYARKARIAAWKMRSASTVENAPPSSTPSSVESEPAPGPRADHLFGWPDADCRCRGCQRKRKGFVLPQCEQCGGTGVVKWTHPTVNVALGRPCPECKGEG
jgi:hypothetical protein